MKYSHRDKIKAFTLIELVFVMLLSSLVILSSLGAFQILVSVMERSNELNSYLKELVYLRSQLEKDFNQAESIMQSSQNSFKINFPDDTSVNYTFIDGNSIIESINRVDTISIGTSSLQFSFIKTNHVKEISLAVSVRESEIPIIIQKDYSNYEKFMLAQKR